MLVITARSQDKLFIEDENKNLLEVIVIKTHRNQIKIGFSSTPKFRIYREDVFIQEGLKKKKENLLLKKFAKSLA
jgi:sRNA-binding carbon storage regulator CsrA